MLRSVWLCPVTLSQPFDGNNCIDHTKSELPAFFACKAKVKTTVAIKPASISAAIKPVAPIAYKSPMADAIVLDRLVKVSLGGTAGTPARTSAKRWSWP